MLKNIAFPGLSRYDPPCHVDVIIQSFIKIGLCSLISLKIIAEIAGHFMKKGEKSKQKCEFLKLGPEIEIVYCFV